MLGQEVLKSKNLVLDTLKDDESACLQTSEVTRTYLDLIKLVTPDDELHPSIALLQGLDPLRDLGITSARR